LAAAQAEQARANAMITVLNPLRRNASGRQGVHEGHRPGLRRVAAAASALAADQEEALRAEAEAVGFYAFASKV
jgi:hypothetical protein